MGQSDPMDTPRAHPPGAPKAVKCGSPSWCPPGFCDPYSSEAWARYRLAKNSWWLLAGIAAAVDSRVVPLWREHLSGGSAPKNLTSSFAADFQSSKTTAATSKFLVDALRSSLTATPPAAPATVTLASRIPTQLAAIGNPASTNQMNFNIPGEIPGNIAGGIGTDQLACKTGEKPSPFNDERRAEGEAVVTSLSPTTLKVEPTIRYTVKDTIDLCPGDCGTILEQVATVPISQYEATGVAGDVPFTVDFTVTPPSFTIPAPSAPVAPAPPIAPPVKPPPPPKGP